MELRPAAGRTPSSRACSAAAAAQFGQSRLGPGERLFGTLQIAGAGQQQRQCGLKRNFLPGILGRVDGQGAQLDGAAHISARLLGDREILVQTGLARECFRLGQLHRFRQILARLFDAPEAIGGHAALMQRRDLLRPRQCVGNGLFGRRLVSVDFGLGRFAFFQKRQNVAHAARRRGRRGGNGCLRQGRRLLRPCGRGHEQQRQRQTAKDAADW